MNNLTFQQQRQDLANSVIAALCGIGEYPEGMFPHTVFVEQESEETGEPVYNHYKLVSIDQTNATCVLEYPATRKREEYDLDAIETDWLITVWGWCRDLMVEQGTWREPQRNLPPEPPVPYGLWAFLYPLDWFDSSAGDDVIMAAWLHEENSDLYNPVERLSPAEFAAQVNSGEFMDQIYFVRMIEVTEHNQPLLKYRRLAMDDFRGIVDTETLEEISDDEARQIETLYNDMVMKAFRDNDHDGVSSFDGLTEGRIVPELLTKAVSEILYCEIVINRPVSPACRITD